MKQKSKKNIIIFISILIILILIPIVIYFIENKKRDNKIVTKPLIKDINEFLEELKSINSVENISSLGKIKFTVNTGQKEFYLQPICGDNQCFYRSFINGLSYLKYKKNLGRSANIQHLIDLLKDLIIQYLQNTNNVTLKETVLAERGGTIENYIKISKDKSYWGGEQEIAVLKEMFKINIFQFTTSFTINHDFTNTTYPIENSVYLYHTGGNHYNSLLPLF